MSRLGSDTSIYADASLPFKERAVRLLSDVLNEIHDSLLQILMYMPGVDLGKLSRCMDSFAEAMPKIDLVGTVESEVTDNTESSVRSTTSANIAKTASSLGLSREQSKKDSGSHRLKKSGTATYSVRFPGIGGRSQVLLH